MKRIFTFALVALACLCGSLCAQEAGRDVPAHLQAISVTIKTPQGQGSGTIKTRDNVHYVWTAAHVVDGLRRVEKVLENGQERQVVTFDDARVVTVFTEDGREVGEQGFFAQVVRYSKQQDLALLKLRKSGVFAENVQFYLDAKIPQVGSKLFHCGSLLGQQGSNSLTDGLMSQHGRLLLGVVYDQVSAVSFPGSSGGGIYLEDGRYVGMLVAGMQVNGVPLGTFNFIVPVRRMREWATRAGVAWAIDDAIPMPTQEVLDALPVEDTGVLPNGSRAESAPSGPIHVDANGDLIELVPLMHWYQQGKDAAN